ncbi:hypothetical protein ADL26_08240, partial [Thermoactinomyces vulgaris]
HLQVVGAGQGDEAEVVGAGPVEARALDDVDLLAQQQVDLPGAEAQLVGVDEAQVGEFVPGEVDAGQAAGGDGEAALLGQFAQQPVEDAFGGGVVEERDREGRGEEDVGHEPQDEDRSGLPGGEPAPGALGRHIGPEVPLHLRPGRLALHGESVSGAA